MDRRDMILAGLDVAGLMGIEIGALDKPLVRPGDGPVLYVDHVDTPTLRQKYAGDPGVNMDTLVEVDAIWGANTLREALQARAATHPNTPVLVDYVIASHVVEHVPDLVGWLNEIQEVLKPTGQLRLAVPDRRFTFDCLREDSRLSDVMIAHLTRTRRPLPQAILDFELNAAPGANFIKLWSGDHSDGLPTPRPDWTNAIRLARDAMEGGYHDAHCWAVTPYSLADIFVALAEHGLLRLACKRFEDTGYGDFEFHLTMVPCDEPDIVAESWRRVRREAKQIAPGSRFRPIDVLSGVAALSTGAIVVPEPPVAADPPELVEQRLLAHERLILVWALEQRLTVAETLAHERLMLIRALEQRLHVAESLADERLKIAGHMEARAKAGETELGLVRQSTSWRLTQPLRAAVQTLRGRRARTS